MALWVHLYPLGLEWPGRARVMFDLMMLQRLAERAVRPGIRAEGPENGGSGSFWGVFRASAHWCKRPRQARREGLDPGAPGLGRRNDRRKCDILCRVGKGRPA